MQKITDDIFLVKNVGGANVIIIGNENEFSIVDTGAFFKTNILLKELEKNSFKIKGLKNIILSHCHGDHIGGVTEIQKMVDAKIVSHKDEVDYILHKKILDGPYRKNMIEEIKEMKKFNFTIQKVDLTVEDGDIIEGFKVINVKGHTPGLITLYNKEKKIMFFSDVIRNNRGEGLTLGIPEKYNVNFEQTKKDGKKLMEYDFDIALFSHGEPIMKNAKYILREKLDI